MKLYLVVLLSLVVSFDLVHCRRTEEQPTAIASVADAESFCLSLLNSHSGRTKWPVEEDCRMYFDCSAFNESSKESAVATKTCPRRTFFNFDIQDCLAEGPIKCQDMCADKDINEHGCFAVPNSCSTYFLCQDSSSQASCCQPGYSFNAENCQCEPDDSCQDHCPVIVEAFFAYDDDYEDETEVAGQGEDVQTKHPCVDSYGNSLYTDDNPKLFHFSDGETTITMECSQNTIFNPKTCQCQEPDAVDIDSAYCLSFFPFDKDVSDQSLANFTGSLVGKVKIDPDNSARSSGSSARFEEGPSHIVYDGFKKYDFGKKASFCFFYKCDLSLSNPLECLNTGTLLSSVTSMPGEDCSVDMVSMATNKFMANVTLERPEENVVVLGPVGKGKRGFTQVCTIYNGKQIELYINKYLYMTVDVKYGGLLKMAHCPLKVGFGSKYGPFAGNIDELLICRRALTAEEVEAHYKGQRSMREAKLIPKENSQ